MKTIIIAIICCLCFVCNANATTAASCSLADVRTAVTETARGGTVIVPAGSCNWNDTLTVTKAITIQGAGSWSTLITSTFQANGKVPGYPFIRYYPTISDASTVFRVTGFQFDAVNYTSMFRVDNSYTTFTAQIRLDNNRYINCARPADSPVTEPYDTRWSHTMNLLGLVKGVVHNNYFSGKPVMQFRRGGTAWKTTVTSWTNGTDNNMFWEDNYFYHNNSYNQIIVAGSGGSNVIRYNTFDYTLRGSNYFYATDAHGAQYNNYYGAFGTEIYGNRFIGAGYHEPTMSRGGYNKVFYNKTVGAVKPAVVIWETYGSIYANVPTGHACPVGSLYYGTSTCSPDGRGQNVEKSYFWNNRYSTSGAGSEITYTAKCGGEAYPACDPTGAAGPKQLVEDTHYWVRKTFDGTSGVGCGTLAARPATCDEGVGYWATTQSCSEVPTASFGENPGTPLSGILYICGSNNWVNATTYVPYQYPHPYREGTDTQAGQLSTPTACSGADCTTPLGCTGESDEVVIGVTATDNIGITGVKCCLENGSTCVPATTYANMGVTLSLQSGTATNGTWGTTVTSACSSTILYNCKGTDAAGNITSNIVISYDTEANEDTTDPTLSTQVLGVAGRTLTLTFSEPVKKGAAYLDTDWIFTVDGSTVSIECPSNAGWDTDTLVCQASECVPTTVALTLDYNQPGVGLGITDQADNTFIIGDAVSVTNNSEQTCDLATSLFTHGESAPSGSTTINDIKAVNLGVKFQSSVAGTITHLWFYKVATNTGTHVGSVWCASASCGGAGTLLGQVTFADETASGWQSMELGTPVGILADVDYIVSYHNPLGIWTQNANYFASTYTNGNLTAPTAGTDYAGRYFYSSSTAYPSGDYGSNYWVDFTMSYASASGPWVVTVSKTGEGCTVSSQPTEPVVDEATSEVVVTVKNGWAVGISGDCPAGSGILSGNTYTYTTGQITEACEVAVTCSEINLVPWVTP